VLKEHIQYSPWSGTLYATGVSLGPPESSTQKASRSLQPILPGSLGDRPTDRTTDHPIRSVTIGGAHSGEAKLCYRLRLQQVYLLEQSTQQIGSTSAISSLLGAYPVRLHRLRVTGPKGHWSERYETPFSWTQRTGIFLSVYVLIKALILSL